MERILNPFEEEGLEIGVEIGYGTSGEDFEFMRVLKKSFSYVRIL